MDTIGLEIPDRHRRTVGLRTAGATVVAVAVAALGAGYAIGQAHVTTAPTLDAGVTHTFGDALDESLALKRRDR